jgi:hypothetical protein
VNILKFLSLRKIEVNVNDLEKELSSSTATPIFLSNNNYKILFPKKVKYLDLLFKE